jgi:hypothetical protein
VRAFLKFTLFLTVLSIAPSLFACPQFNGILTKHLKNSEETALLELEKAGKAGLIKDANGNAIDFQDETVRSLISNRKSVLHGQFDFHPSPKDLPAFPGARKVKGKTPKRNGGGVRKRWLDRKGNIYEWDSQHGAVEKYNKTGKVHLGEFDPITGRQTKEGIPSRKVQK